VHSENFINQAAFDFILLPIIALLEATTNLLSLVYKKVMLVGLP